MLTSVNPFIAAHERFEQARQADPEWVRRLRSTAFTRFTELGLPTLHNEDWKYTNPAPFAHPEFDLQPAPLSPPLAAAQAYALGLGNWTQNRLVFVDGDFAPDVSSVRVPAGCVAGSLAAALAHDGEIVRANLSRHVDSERHVFAAVNTAFTADGAYVYAADGVTIAEPIHLLFVTSGRSRVMSHPRNLVVAGAHASVTVVEHYVSLDDAPTLTNAVTEIVAGMNADVRHVQLQRQALGARFIETLHVNVQRDARFSSQAVSLGAALARNDFTVVLDGEGAYCGLDGLLMTGGSQHADYHTTITHARPHGTSREWFKGIAAGNSTGVFNGRIVVPPDSQKTDSEQGIHTLLLSRDAAIDAKPQLEIFADDVKCAHGATVGQLDEAALFYFQARGIDRAAARAMLTHAFAIDVLERIPIEPLRAALDLLVSAWLPAHEGVA